MRAPMPRVNIKRKMVCVYSTHLEMFDLVAITNKGKVSKMFARQTAFTIDIHEAFRKFTVPFAGFKAIPAIDKEKCKSWNHYIETVWAAANKSKQAKAS